MIGKKKDAPPKFNPSPGLVKLSYRLLMEDKAMVGVLAVGAAASTVALCAIIVPAWTIGHITPDPTHRGLRGLLVYAAAVWAVSVISVLSQGVVVAAAQIRCERGSPDLKRAAALAWSRRGPLAAWAAVSTVIALLMTLLQRLGIAGLIVRVLTGVAWSVATIFAVPILIAEGTGPGETTRRSFDVVKSKLGTVVRSNIRLALPWMVAMWLALMVAAAGGIAFAVGVGTGSVEAAVIGAPVLVAGVLAFLFCAATSTALSAFLDTLLYRYASGLPVPDIAPYDLPPAPAWS
ncbi:MAG TPA: DUF6159 family protein [Marmoricola sp.]|nr:DUF6159 family protein [Marmoricola sp.]